jgi:hypothetical protein
MAVLFDKWAQTAASKEERRDFLEMATTMRQAAAKLDASAATVRQLDQRGRSKP